MADADRPPGILLERHRDLRGRDRYLWSRRAVLLVLLVVVVAGLANVFGQRPQTQTAAAPTASLKVYAPRRVRSGDIFTARFHVSARSVLARAFDLVLLVVIGELVQQGVTQDDYSVTSIVLVVGTFTLLQVAVSYLNFRFRPLRQVR